MVEDEWADGMFPPPPRLPEYDWDLHRYLRQMKANDGNYLRFYNSARWKRLRRRVLEECHCESLMELSQSPARYVPADTVHHRMRVHQHPGWALSEWAVDGGALARNLIPLSHQAHDIVHGRFGPQQRKPALTEEWW